MRADQSSIKGSGNVEVITAIFRGSISITHYAHIEFRLCTLQESFPARHHAIRKSFYHPYDDCRSAVIPKAQWRSLPKSAVAQIATYSGEGDAGLQFKNTNLHLCETTNSPIYPNRKRRPTKACMPGRAHTPFFLTPWEWRALPSLQHSRLEHRF